MKNIIQAVWQNRHTNMLLTPAGRNTRKCVSWKREKKIYAAILLPICLASRYNDKNFFIPKNNEVESSKGFSPSRFFFCVCVCANIKLMTRKRLGCLKVHFNSKKKDSQALHTKIICKAFEPSVPYLLAEINKKKGTKKLMN